MFALPTCILIVLFHECGYCIFGANEHTIVGGGVCVQELHKVIQLFVFQLLAYAFSNLVLLVISKHNNINQVIDYY
jgi:hypothetical protein